MSSDLWSPFNKFSGASKSPKEEDTDPEPMIVVDCGSPVSCLRCCELISYNISQSDADQIDHANHELSEYGHPPSVSSNGSEYWNYNHDSASPTSSSPGSLVPHAHFIDVDLTQALFKVYILCHLVTACGNQLQPTLSMFQRIPRQEVGHFKNVSRFFLCIMASSSQKLGFRRSSRPGQPYTYPQDSRFLAVPSQLSRTRSLSGTLITSGSVMIKCRYHFHLGAYGDQGQHSKFFVGEYRDSSPLSGASSPTSQYSVPSPSPSPSPDPGHHMEMNPPLMRLDAGSTENLLGGMCLIYFHNVCRL